MEVHVILKGKDNYQGVKKFEVLNSIFLEVQAGKHHCSAFHNAGSYI